MSLPGRILSGTGKGAVIFPSAFLVAVAEGTLGLGLVFFMRQVYDASPSLIGALVASGTFVYVIGCLLVRPLFDPIRPRYLLIAAAAAMAAALVLLVLLRSIPLTFLFFGLHHLATALFWPTAMGWITQGIEGDDLNRLIGRFNLSWSTGLVLSPVLAGLLSERSAVQALAVAVLLYAANLLLVGAASFALPRVRRDDYRERRAEGKAAEGLDRSTFLRYPAWIGMFTNYVVGGVLTSIFPIFARDSLALRESLVGGLLSARILLQAAGFWLLGRVSFWHFRGRYAPAGQAVLALLVAALLAGRAPVYLAAVFGLLGLAAAFHYTYSLFHGVSGSVRRAGRMAIHEALLTGGTITGSAAGGLLYQHVSMNAVYLFCIAWTAAGLLAQAALLAARSRRAEGGSAGSAGSAGSTAAL